MAVVGMRQWGLAWAAVAAGFCGSGSTLAAGTHVAVTLDVKGDLFAAPGQSQERGQDQGQEPARSPVAMKARFEFVESPPDEAAGLPDAAVIRRYSEAATEMTVDGRQSRCELATDVPTVAVARQGTTAVPYLTDAFLSRDEADLLETPFDSILLDEMRPSQSVADGEAWQLPGDVTAGLLAIDTVENGTIEATLGEITDGIATIALAGVVDGAVDGVPTHVVVEGTFQAAVRPEEDRHVVDGLVSNVSIVLKERRQASHVAPGFEVEARLEVTRSVEPEATDVATDESDDGDIESDVVADDAAPGVVADRRGGAGRPGRLWHRDAEGRYDLVYDARWRTVEENAGGLVMRLVDHGALVAQCSIMALPRANVDVRPTTQDVQRDIQKSLVGQFGRFDGVSETVRDDGVTVVRVVSVGTAESLPFRWIHYVLADEEGRRTGVTFMLEDSLEKRFADADRALVEGLRLVADAPREARLPRKTMVP